MQMLGNYYRDAKSRPRTQAQVERNVTRVAEFVAFVFCGALCMAFFVAFKTYHSSL
jgi:hypothetical protein